MFRPRLSRKLVSLLAIVVSTIGLGLGSAGNAAASETTEGAPSGQQLCCHYPF